MSYGTSTAAAAGATLPFTGLGLGWIVTAALLALFLGTGLFHAAKRRAVRP